MKRKCYICLLLAIAMHIGAKAQGELPLENGYSFGGGILTGLSEGKNDYMNVADKPLCFDFTADYRHYFIPSVALGVTYEYITSSRQKNKMRCHYIAPTLTLRYLYANGKQGIFGTLGAGYFQYGERISGNRHAPNTTFNKGYFGASIGLGYECAVSRGFSMQFKIDFLLADWHFNPSYEPKWQRDNPDEYQSIFENNFSYVSFGVAFQFGK